MPRHKKGIIKKASQTRPLWSVHDADPTTIEMLNITPVANGKYYRAYPRLRINTFCESLEFAPLR